MTYLDIDGSKLYYEAAGEGETLVLSHAGFVDGGMWDAQWEEFAKHYRVIRYDMRGFGKSDPINAPISRRDDLYRLLRHLNVERATLVGVSLGGEVSLDFALEHPDMVSALVVVSAAPGGFEMQGAPPPNLLDMIGAAQQGDVERASELQIRIWIDGMYRQPEQVNADVRQHAAAMNLIAVRNGTWAFEMQPLNPLNPPAVRRLSEIHAPTLIVAGDLDHPEILRAADAMESGIAGARKAIVPGTAHMPSMEQPEEFNRVVLEFLRETVRV